MKLISNLLVGLVSLSHVGFLVLEMFFWDHPVGRKIFGLTPDGFLAAGLLWGLWSGQRDVVIFFLLCVIVAGIFGAATAKITILYTQALPALIALLFVLLA